MQHDVGLARSHPTKPPPFGTARPADYHLCIAMS
jgi:hypothetical protein